MTSTRNARVVATVLLVAACGGESGGVAPTTAATGSTVATEPTATTAAIGGGEAGRAVVTVGDQTWEFSFEVSLAQCTYYAGYAIAGVGFTTTPDGDRATFENQTAVALEFELPVPGNTEVEPSIIVTDNVNDVEWRAGAVELLASVPQGASQVDQWEVGDATATASATFLEWNAATSGGGLTSITGSLEASCG